MDSLPTQTGNIPVSGANSLNVITDSSQSEQCVNVTVEEVNVEAQLHDLITQNPHTRQPADLRLDSQSLETLVHFLISLLPFLSDCAGHVTVGFTLFQTIAVG